MAKSHEMMTELVDCWSEFFENQQQQENIVEIMEQKERMRLEYLKEFKKKTEDVVKAMHKTKRYGMGLIFRKSRQMFINYDEVKGIFDENKKMDNKASLSRDKALLGKYISAASCPQSCVFYTPTMYPILFYYSKKRERFEIAPHKISG